MKKVEFSIKSYIVDEVSEKLKDFGMTYDKLSEFVFEYKETIENIKEYEEKLDDIKKEIKELEIEELFKRIYDNSDLKYTIQIFNLGVIQQC